MTKKEISSHTPVPDKNANIQQTKNVRCKQFKILTAVASYFVGMLSSHFGSNGTSNTEQQLIKYLGSALLMVCNGEVICVFFIRELECGRVLQFLYESTGA